MDYELKARFDLIQGCLDACAEHSFNTLVNNLESKRKHLSEERYHALHQYELNEARCELNSLYYSVPLISEIADLHEHTDWLWNSGIFESIPKEAKRKWLIFRFNDFDHTHYQSSYTAYSDELPYFREMVNATSLERYIGYLGNNPAKIAVAEKKTASFPQIQVVTVPAQQSTPQKEETAPKKKNAGVPTVKPKCADTKDPFECRLNKRQISLLVDCVNEVKMFNNPVSVEELTAIFRGKLIAEPLRVRNNRVLAFFFGSLAEHGKITSQWQSTIANCRLFFPSKKDDFINQSDLSSAWSYIKDCGYDGKYETIGNYIKQLKKL